MLDILSRPDLKMGFALISLARVWGINLSVSLS